jgi:hypothetical protein
MFKVVQPTVRTRPLGDPPTWTVVIGAADRRCECTGACGRRHSRTDFRCDRTHDQGGIRLIAAPTDLALPLSEAAELTPDELRAWCPDCHRLAKRQHEGSRAARQQLDTPPTETLFDL